jgi:hypothetical protein
MGKRIVICCDGTGNGFDPIEPESNVTKYYSILTINSEQTVLLSSGCLNDGLPPPTAVGASNASGPGLTVLPLDQSCRQTSETLTVF